MKLHDADWYASAADHQAAEYWASLTPAPAPPPLSTLVRSHHHASVATGELERLEDGASALVREREWDRLHD